MPLLLLPLLLPSDVNAAAVVAAAVTPLPGFIDDKARFPRRLITLCIDGVCILIGALLGTSPLSVVAESSVGIKEGGRTGGCVCGGGGGVQPDSCPDRQMWAAHTA